MKTFIITVFFLSFFTNSVLAICSGFQFAIGNLIKLNASDNRWNVYDNNCNVVDGLTTNQNPCTQGIFSCSPAPIYFMNYTSTSTGLEYPCVRDPNAENCENDALSVCCAEVSLPASSSPPQSSDSQSTGSTKSSSSTTAQISQTAQTSSPTSESSDPTSSSASASDTSQTFQSTSSSTSDTITTPLITIPTFFSTSSEFATSSSSPPAASDTTSGSSATKSLSSGAIAGIVVGVVLVLLIIALVTLFCYRKRRNQDSEIASQPLPFTSQRPVDTTAVTQSTRPMHSRFQSSDSRPTASDSRPTGSTGASASTSASTRKDRARSPAAIIRTPRTSVDAGPVESLRLPPPYNHEWREDSSNG